MLLGFSGMYLGRALLTDVVAAFVLGWGAAALVHFAFGTPARRPTAWEVSDALAKLSAPVDHVHPADQQPVGRAMFQAVGDDGPVRVIALGRDEADTQFLSRMWRWLAYRDAPPVLMATRRRQIEFETYVMLLAAEFGARVPRVVRSGCQGALALLVVDEVEGTPLRDLEGDVQLAACSTMPGPRPRPSMPPGWRTVASMPTTLSFVTQQ